MAPFGDEMCDLDEFLCNGEWGSFSLFQSYMRYKIGGPISPYLSLLCLEGLTTLDVKKLEALSTYPGE